MADILTPEQRSRLMARIRGGNTKPELTLRSMLHRMGYRFTVHGPKNKCLPGRPDLVLPKFRTVIFVHGCFWHGHEGCKDFRIPATRREWWTTKIENNQSLDARVQAELQDLGWHVVTIWACALKNSSARLWLETRIPRLLGDEIEEVETESLRVAEEAVLYQVPSDQ